VWWGRRGVQQLYERTFVEHPAPLTLPNGDTLPPSSAPPPSSLVQANCRTHRPQKLKCLISLCTNPVSILSAPIQTVR
jgi:hypothetical protein